MNNLDPEKLRELYPQAFWAGYRQGRAEALSDPNVQKEAADAYLKSELAKGPAASATAQAPAITISAEQTAINAQLGLSTEEFVKYNRETPSQLDPVQAEINARLGLPEEEFLRFAK